MPGSRIIHRSEVAPGSISEPTVDDLQAFCTDLAIELIALSKLETRDLSQEIISKTLLYKLIEAADIDSQYGDEIPDSALALIYSNESTKRNFRLVRSVEASISTTSLQRMKHLFFNLGRVKDIINKLGDDGAKHVFSSIGQALTFEHYPFPIGAMGHSIEARGETLLRFLSVESSIHQNTLMTKITSPIFLMGELNNTYNLYYAQ